MPRAARFRIAAIDDLLRQLRYTPAETLQRMMDAAERLAGEIDPARNYPEEFIVYRITGYRPETAATSVLVGEALVPDLVAMVQHISRKLDLPPNHRGRCAIPLEEVGAKLRVSMKSLQRYRAQGLICHYIRFERDNPQRLGCFIDALDHFIASHGTRVQKAAEFSRISDDDSVRIIAEARELRERSGLSLNETAKLIAARNGRAHETIRLLLRRHDRCSPHPIFTGPGSERIADRQARLIHRAWQFGIDAPTLAQRFGRTVMTIHRIINRRRLAILRSINITWLTMPTFGMDGAAEVILSHPIVNSNLDDLLPTGDAIALVLAARTAKQVKEDAEHALIGAHNFLKRRAAMSIASMPDWPSAAALDRAETDLRWAAALKRRLVSLGLPAAIKTIEQNLSRPLDEQPADAMVPNIALAIGVVSGVADSVDPSRRQRFARLCALAMDKAMARTSSAESTRRAAARHSPGSVPLRDSLRRLSPWDSFLNPRPALRDHLGSLNPQRRRMVIARYGWHGEPPRTIAEIAAIFNIGEGATARILRTAEVELLHAARSG